MGEGKKQPCGIGFELEVSIRTRDFKEEFPSTLPPKKLETMRYQ